MLTQGEDVDARALRKRGWSISAIARHLGRSRPTIRAYLNGEREPGRRRRSLADPFEPYADYCRLRLDEQAGDPHLWATTLFDEVVELGYEGGYSTFTRALRARGLRPDCETCAHALRAASGGQSEQSGSGRNDDRFSLPRLPDCSAAPGTRQGRLRRRLRRWRKRHP
ncbi:helix-turn-helix domain-containing protein [Planomonospora venezuelensis]|uniref:HTH IS21-type domain-containing protein n=1 Tax=Planomonospora venezuelensis TaxID=1999 RepID=A0A841D441_PLAVE|nr:helix-turn-helix domain-containing protein [Planomonospora venezuelensis]MBB5965021.1 hypothetical protein [Planomonospora venezuelensis]GIN05769.1 hypothetical protein Pve01_74270 [Planomonospora venezuelensis]